MYPDLRRFLKARPPVLSRGPLAVIQAEDMLEVESTLRHHLDLGFRSAILLAPHLPPLPEAIAARTVVVRHTAAQDGPLTEAISRIAAAVAPETWIFGCYNAEYLYFPFSDTRAVGDLLAFHAEERRRSVPCMVVDLYAPDLERHPDGVDLETACFDGRGYYALARENPAQNFAVMERQVDLYGGLRWRFEEHVPWNRRRIDRVALFRTQRGLTLAEDWTLSDSDLNTLHCEWHRNLTAAIGSFRAAKALMRNPGSRRAIRSFLWHGSERHDWTGRLFLDLGFMEPGQWF